MPRISLTGFVVVVISCAACAVVTGLPQEWWAVHLGTTIEFDLHFCSENHFRAQRGGGSILHGDSMYWVSSLLILIAMWAA